MRIVYDDEALDDLQRICTRIVKDNPTAAVRLVSAIFDKVERLATPEVIHMGRPGLDPGTRELLQEPYIIVYEVHESSERIVVLSVVHGAQDRT